MKLISSLPCEIIGLILASSWKSYTGTILWHIGQTEILGFTDALIAVRATEIVKQAALRRDLPPTPLPLGKLGGDIRRPTLDEMKVLFDFRHLVECLERLFKENSHPYWYDGIARLEPEDRMQAWMVWKERLHVALYRGFLSGAALYRAYQEPLTMASTCGLPRFLDGFWRVKGDGAGTLTSAEKRYLLQYPIFKFEEFQQHGDIFQPLADIFVQESKRKAKVVNALKGATLYERYGAEQYDPAVLERSHAQALFHQLLQFMFVAHSGILQEIIRNEDGYPYKSRTGPIPKKMPGRHRTVTVIFFDVLSFEEIIMPENVEDVIGTFVLARPGLGRPVDNGSNLSGVEYVSRNIEKLLYEIQWFSGQPNYYWPSCRTPPPELQFVRYMLSKYFRLRFKANTWDWNEPSSKAWYVFINSGDVFCERILADECEGACALLESINAPLPEPYFAPRA
ncbi:hypothetical protein CNMCM5623_000234 [Aspergillus felis]|uniref:Uncharacterized protein n=1 Tax=Aspergillus felis TaxID=1287682 RepID=A0A8H6V760_9EURO|nr:hypothetical protein CNMCM5623_000234 [Aspergillus felis]KAF7176405.1 hypothetical protein CNMCM7691_002534 [Aspergillus felis]